MPYLLGPSHHVFYGALHRRRLWLAHLAIAFQEYADPSWPDAKEKLDRKFKRLFLRLSSRPHLGIAHPLPLGEAIDDTPTDSFLMNLAEELNAYEHCFFDSIVRQGAEAPIDRSFIKCQKELEETSALWGRELAQECLLSSKIMSASSRPKNIRGIFELFHNVLQGGDFSWKPLLLRRYTDHELQYELRDCPHRKQPSAEKTSSANLACTLEAAVFRGFALAFIPEASFARQTHPNDKRGSYCVDELHLR